MVRGPYGEGKEQVTEGDLEVLMVKARSKYIAEGGPGSLW